jgi:hypothetical protein
MREESTPTRHGANSTRKMFFLADKRCEAYAFKPLSLWKEAFLIALKSLSIKNWRVKYHVKKSICCL